MFAAIKAGYARTITYYVFAAPPTSAAYRHNANDPTLVLEEYQFTIGYGDETGLDDGFARVAGVAVGGRRLGDKQRGPKTRIDDEEKIKDAGDQMLRQLEALIANLDPLPPGSKIGIRMTYVRDTPPEYEPPFFEAAAPKPESLVETRAAADADADDNVNAVDCGQVDTRFHTMTLRWRDKRQAQACGGGDDATHAYGDITEKENVLPPAAPLASAAAAARLANERTPDLPSARSYPNDLPFESQADPEQDPVFRVPSVVQPRDGLKPTDLATTEARDYHYQHNSESRPFDSESQGVGFPPPTRAPPPGISRAAPKTQNTGSVGLSMSRDHNRKSLSKPKRSPSSPFGTLGSGKKAKQTQAGSFSFGDAPTGSQFSRESLGGVLFGKQLMFGGGFWSPIRCVHGSGNGNGNGTQNSKERPRFDFDAKRNASAPEAAWKKTLRG